MILIRKAARLAVLISTSIALAYYGLNGTSGQLASIMVIFASIEIPLAWASVWQHPEDEHTLQRMRD